MVIAPGHGRSARGTSISSCGTSSLRFARWWSARASTASGGATRGAAERRDATSLSTPASTAHRRCRSGIQLGQRMYFLLLLFMQLGNAAVRNPTAATVNAIADEAAYVGGRGVGMVLRVSRRDFYLFGGNKPLPAPLAAHLGRLNDDRDRPMKGLDKLDSKLLFKSGVSFDFPGHASCMVPPAVLDLLPYAMRRVAVWSVTSGKLACLEWPAERVNTNTLHSYYIHVGPSIHCKIHVQ